MSRRALEHVTHSKNRYRISEEARILRPTDTGASMSSCARGAGAAHSSSNLIIRCAHLDLVAGLDHLWALDPASVEKRAVRRAEIAEHPAAAPRTDLGVLARDVRRPVQDHVALAAAAERRPRPGPTTTWRLPSTSSERASGHGCTGTLLDAARADPICGRCRSSSDPLRRPEAVRSPPPPPRPAERAVSESRTRPARAGRPSRTLDLRACDSIASLLTPRMFEEVAAELRDERVPPHSRQTGRGHVVTETRGIRWERRCERPTAICALHSRARLRAISTGRTSERKARLNGLRRGRRSCSGCF